MSTINARLHAASLVPRSFHNPQLLRLVEQREVSHSMVCYIARQTRRVVRLESDHVGPAGIPSPPNSPHKVSFADQSNRVALVPLEHFIATLARQSHVYVATLLGTLVYLERLRPKLSFAMKGQWNLSSLDAY